MRRTAAMVSWMELPIGSEAAKATQTDTPREQTSSPARMARSRVARSMRAVVKPALIRPSTAVITHIAIRRDRRERAQAGRRQRAAATPARMASPPEVSRNADSRARWAGRWCCGREMTRSARAVAPHRTAPEPMA